MQTLKAALTAFQYFFASSSLAQVASWSILFAFAGAVPFAVRAWVWKWKGAENLDSGRDGFIGHLIQLRSHVVWVLSSVVVVFLLLTVIAGMFTAGWDGWRWLWVFPGAGAIYEFLAAPLLENLPRDNSLIAIGTVSPIFVPMKAAFFVAVCVVMPFILNEVWSFVAPGLYPWYDDKTKRLVYNAEGAEKGRDEKTLAVGLMATSAFLFYLGVVVAYFLVFHVVFGAVAAVTPDAVNWTPDIGELLGFMLLIFFAFGVAFEVPVAVFILVRAGVVELDTLRQARPYVIVGAFIVAAIVTPPDILSQFLLAIPCWLLYEAGLWFTARWGGKKEDAPDGAGA